MICEPVASVGNMECRMQIPRWILALVTLLTWFVGMAAPVTPDGLALLEFKNSLTVISPLLANWNASDVLPCTWGGITCTHSGRVRNIMLPAQVPMLEGIVSASLGKLDLLEGLVLDHNMLSGSIPLEIGNLRSLTTLVLSSNILSGRIPPHIGNCSSLVQLWVDMNMLSGDIPESLGNLKSLQIFNLSSNLLTGELSLTLQLSLTSMTNLSGFDIWNNSLSGSGPPLVYKNLAIAYYDVSFNNFSGDITLALDDMSKLPSIGFIAVESNSFTGILPPSNGNATNLYHLSLGLSYIWGERNGIFGGEIPKEIGKLVNLTTLYLGNNNFTGDIPLELLNMTSLTYLDLGQNNLQGQIPLKVGSIRSLNYLLLRDNKLTGILPSSLGNLVNLTWMDFTNNSITGPIPNSFRLLTNLQILGLGQNNLTGPIPIFLSKTATNLEQVLFYDNNMSGPIPYDFGRFMPNLNRFGISNNSFNGTLPDGLCQSGKLQGLVANGNYLHGDVPSSFVNCTSLTRIRLADNMFTSIPDGFGSNSMLQYLDVSRNQMTGRLPMDLGVNSQLTYLDLSDNMLTGDLSLLQFLQLAQNLSFLNFAWNNFIGEIPATIGVCKLLYSVDLSYNSLTGTVPIALANLTNLQELHLQGNNLNKFHSSIYLGFTALRILNLANNPWNSTNIAIEIGSLTILQILNLSYGGYTGSIPSSLKQLTQLEVLDLSHNNLTGEVPWELGELMTSLVYVNISFNHLTGSLPPTWVKFLLTDPTSFQGNQGLCLQYNATNMCVTRSLDSSARAKLKLPKRVILSILLGAVLALALVVALVVIVIFCFRKHRPVKSENLTKDPVVDKEELEISNLTSEPWIFTYEEIMKATEDLSNKYVIGRGGHGTVYKVDCASGSRPSIVVKKVSFEDKKTQIPLHKSFWSEVKTVGKAKHRNLVRLLGFIKRDEIGLLLYDYVSNGDLYSTLHKTKLGLQVHLNWEARLHIARGVAHGLAYLHHDYGTPIVHRDIKSSNVLLDNDLEAHISDFGLAKVLDMEHSESKPWLSTQNVLGTLGYIAPEAAFGTFAKPQVDVYAFGIILLELLTGKEVTNDPCYSLKDSHVVAWVKGVVEANKGKMSESVLDSLLLQSKNLGAIGDMHFVLEVALLCTLQNPAERPTMRSVENMLETLSFSSTTEKVIGDTMEKVTKDTMEWVIWKVKKSTEGNIKENGMDIISNNRHEESCNQNQHDRFNKSMLDIWNMNRHDCSDESMLNVWKMNVSNEGSEEQESFWSKEGVGVDKN